MPYRQGWRGVAAILHDARVDEVLVEVVDILHDLGLLLAGANADVVEHRKVLHVFAEPDPAGVRADRDAELGCHEHHGDELVDALKGAPDTALVIGLQAQSATTHSNHP